MNFLYSATEHQYLASLDGLVLEAGTDKASKKI